MKIGILFRPGSLWIGGHYSSKNRRWCINLVPCVTVWVVREGGIAPDARMDICRSDRETLAQEKRELAAAQAAFHKSTRSLERVRYLFNALESQDTPASSDTVAHLETRQKLHDALDKPVSLFKEEVDAALLPTPEPSVSQSLHCQMLELGFRFSNDQTANEVEQLASALITKAEGVEVTANTTGLGQCIAERLQQAHPSVKLGSASAEQFPLLKQGGPGQHLGSSDSTGKHRRPPSS